eukprot:6326825-Prymnesium_polylepis.1
MPVRSCHRSALPSAARERGSSVAPGGSVLALLLRSAPTTRASGAAGCSLRSRVCAGVHARVCAEEA